MRRERVHRPNALIEQFKTMGRIDLFRVHSNAGGRNQKTINAIFGTRQLWVGLTKIKMS